MSDDRPESLEGTLKGYKEKINPQVKGTLTWDRDLIFTGRTGEGYEIEFDAHVQWGCKPTDALLLSLAGCMGIDTVMFLQKMRAELASFRINIVGDRNPTPPQYFRAMDMVLHIAGRNLDEKKVERAINLSQQKYCSVYNSLRPDMQVAVKYVLEEKDPPKREKGVTD